MNVTSWEDVYTDVYVERIKVKKCLQVVLSDGR